MSLTPIRPLTRTTARTHATRISMQDFHDAYECITIDDANRQALLQKDQSDYANPRMCLVRFPEVGCAHLITFPKPNEMPFSKANVDVVLRTTKGLQPGHEIYVMLIMDAQLNSTPFKTDKTWKQLMTLRCNRTVFGVFGDAFLNVFDIVKENDTIKCCTQGNMLPRHLVHDVFSSLKRKQDVSYCPFSHMFEDIVTDNLEQNYEQDPRLGGVLEMAFDIVYASVKHRHIERLEVSTGYTNENSMNLAIKSKEAVMHLSRKLNDALRFWVKDENRVVINMDGIDEYLRGLPSQLPNASLTFDEYGRRMKPLILRLYDDHFRLLRNRAEASIDLERRIKACEARDEDEAAERAALNAERAVKVAAQRLASLEAGVAAETASTPRKEKGKSKGGKGGGKGKNRAAPTRSAEAAAIHDHHVSPDEKARRTAVWELRQEVAHLEAEARRARLEAERLKTASEAEGARLALKEQVVPSAPTVAAFFEAGEA